MRKKKIWTEEKLNEAKKLLQNTSASKAGVIMGFSRNAILGALYREKEKNGYVPPLNSPYARIRKYRKGFG